MLFSKTLAFSLSLCAITAFALPAPKNHRHAKPHGISLGESEVEEVHPRSDFQPDNLIFERDDALDAGLFERSIEDEPATFERRGGPLDNPVYQKVKGGFKEALSWIFKRESDIEEMGAELARRDIDEANTIFERDNEFGLDLEERDVDMENELLERDEPEFDIEL